MGIDKGKRPNQGREEDKESFFSDNLLHAKKDKKSNSLIHYSHIGLQFGLTIISLFFLGHWLEDRWDFKPWGTIAGAFLGFIVAFYHLMKSLQNMQKDSE